MKKLLRYLFSVIGLGLFVWLVFKIGPSKIVTNFAKIGWYFIPVFAISIVWYLCYTLAWIQFLRPLNKKLKFRELFRIKIIGEALNTLTPMNFVAGDPARAYLLRHRFPITEGTASVVVDRTLHTIGILVVVLLGIAAAFVELKFLPKNIKYGLPIVFMVASVFVTFVFIHQQKGLFTLIASIAQRLRIKKSFSTKTLEKFEEVDGHIQDFYKKNKRGFWIALSAHIFGRFLGIIEIYMIGLAANQTFPFKAAILLGAAAPIINFIFAFIPGSLGVLESAYSGILYFLNISPSVGLTIQIIRRLRSAIWIAIGFVCLGVQGRKNLLKAEAEKEI